MSVKKSFLSLCLGFLLCGCAILPLKSIQVPHPSGRSKPEISSDYREAVGVIHIHSTYSDGQLPIEPIAGVASRQGLDFLIFTDHNTLRPKSEGREGRYGKTLVLAGDEISTAGGHYVALRVGQEVAAREDPQWTIDQVAKQGGLGFIAHPFWRKSSWKNTQVRGFTGMEIYNAAQNATEVNPLQIGLETLMAGPDLSIGWWLRRSDKSLALWDRYLNERGRGVVGVGGADAHGLKKFGLRLGPYGAVFKLVRNHLLIHGELTEAAVYDALERGHLFVAHDVVADARGFLFAATVAQPVQGIPGGPSDGIMGDEVKFSPQLRIYAYLPSPGHMTLFKNGERAAQADGQQAWFSPPGPGIYRLEATCKGKPWIYSNPIYVVE